MTDLVLIERPAEGVVLLRINRPEARNALNLEVRKLLARYLAEFGEDTTTRAIVLTGSEKSFAAGADIKEMADAGTIDMLQRGVHKLWRSIAACPKPVIARVHGDAYAGGMGLVAACDIAIASFNAAFCLSETRLGLIPATIGPYVVRAMGNAARRYFLTAEKFDASEAYRVGLVHELAPPEELDGRVNQLLGDLIQTSGHAVTEAKRLVRDLAGRAIDDALVADTAERIAAIRTSEDGREGVQAFLEKRKSRWVAEYEATAAQDDEDEEM